VGEMPFPEWVIAQKKRGFEIKQIGNGFYIYDSGVKTPCKNGIRNYLQHTPIYGIIIAYYQPYGVLDMSFRTNGHQQISMHDRLNNLTDRERRMLTKSWAEPFATRIFPLIDESIFEVLYCNDNGRPNTPVNVVVGSLLLKELANLTDEELVESVIFDPRFQHALHLTSCDEIPYSDRTPSRFRERLYKHELKTGEDLLKEEIERLSGEFAKLMKIQSSISRMDSVMVSSSCKNMSRLELMYTCTSNLVKTIIKLGEAGMLPARLLSYAEDNQKNAVCYRLEKDEVTTRLEEVTLDALLVYELCGEGFEEISEYQLLSRMLNDQTRDGQLKPNKEISPQSLQNPSDSDATFRRKAGEQHQGYVANVVEVCGENGNIITHYDFDVNRHSDAEFGAEVIESLGSQEEKLVLIADGAFASEANFEAAEKNNIELVATKTVRIEKNVRSLFKKELPLSRYHNQQSRGRNTRRS
jgi:hypothetical protein